MMADGTASLQLSRELLAGWLAAIGLMHRQPRQTGKKEEARLRGCRNQLAEQKKSQCKQKEIEKFQRSQRS